MFELIEQYINRSKEDRQRHLRLQEPCVQIGGDSRQFRALLAHFLKTTIPQGYMTHLCHACSNEKCSNPLHLYWGTPKENNEDTERSGKSGFKSGGKNSKSFGKGNTITKGTIWVNDGFIEKRVTSVPFGFHIGRL